MPSWGEFVDAAPDLARAGEKLFRRFEVAYLATVRRDGTPRMAPVCPILTEGTLYLSVGRSTPKRLDLLRTGHYALHACLGESDEEFQIWGRATLIDDAAERNRVHEAIRFQFEREDPVFRLDVERCLWGYWENVGKPGTRPVRSRWVAP
jgi:hypothetical protein